MMYVPGLTNLIAVIHVDRNTRLARRTGPNNFDHVEASTIAGLAQQGRTFSIMPTAKERHPAISPATGKSYDAGRAAGAPPRSQRRSLRTLPFSSRTFRAIAQEMCIHGSIARAISRADMPVFSASEVRMQFWDGRRHNAIGTS